jgi:hypothetical protein
VDASGDFAERLRGPIVGGLSSATRFAWERRDAASAEGRTTAVLEYAKPQVSAERRRHVRGDLVPPVD